jgi:hypothetical protein
LRFSFLEVWGPSAHPCGLTFRLPGSRPLAGPEVISLRSFWFRPPGAASALRRSLFPGRTLNLPPPKVQRRLCPAWECATLSFPGRH